MKIWNKVKLKANREKGKVNMLLMLPGRMAGFCMLCELGQHMRQCLKHPGGVIKPHVILQKLKSKQTTYQ